MIICGALLLFATTNQKMFVFRNVCIVLGWQGGFVTVKDETNGWACLRSDDLLLEMRTRELNSPHYDTICYDNRKSWHMPVSYSVTQFHELACFHELMGLNLNLNLSMVPPFSHKVHNTHDGQC
jgi:hypothetical protein